MLYLAKTLGLSRLYISFILSAIFIFCGKNSFAQHGKNTPYSSTVAEKEIKSKEFLKKALNASRVDISKAKKYALTSYRLAIESTNDTLILNSAKTTGIIYKMLENIDSAQFYSKIGITYADKIRNKRTAAVLTTLVANTYSENGKYDAAYDYFENAENRYKTLNSDTIDPTYFFFKINKARLFKDLTLHDLMLNELFEAERIADSISDESFMPQILGGIAVGYKDNGDFKKAISYNKKSLKYIRKGELDEAIIYTNIGNSFSSLREVDSALIYYENARDVYKNRNVDAITFAKLDIAQAEMYLENDLPQKALFILKEIKDSLLGNRRRAKLNLLKSKLSSIPSQKLAYAIEALKYADLSSDIIIQKESYFILYEEYKRLNKYDKSLGYFELYQTLADSIFNKEKSKAIQKVILKKVVDDKNLEIQLNKLRFEKTKAEKDRTILFVVLALFLALLVLGFIYFRYRSQKQKTRIKIQEKKILEKDNESIKNELIHVVFESDRNIQFLEETKEKLRQIKLSSDKDTQISSLFALINSFVLTENEKKNYQDKFSEVRDDFFEKISAEIKLTKTEKKLAALLKLDLSTKEIAAVLNVTDSTVEVYRSRLRKKLQIDKDLSFTEYFNSL